MKCQLILQWPATALKDYDELVEIENTLLEKLSAFSCVDGHDAGVGEMNIFIATDNPTNTFQELKAILGSKDYWVDSRVAYRESDGEQYTILWPHDLGDFQVS